MRIANVVLGIGVATASVAFAQAYPEGPFSPSSTIPIAFSKTVDANKAHVGDIVLARTMQPIQRANGEIIPAGAKVTGHVTAANAFAFNRTPYAIQTASTLAVHFDLISTASTSYPLNVYVRAMADPINSWDARKPKPSDEDEDGTLTQVGGELFKPHQGEVINTDEDVVGYSRHGNIVAHLIASQGNSPSGCGSGTTEQPVAIFSANACGLYGFSGTNLVSSGRSEDASTVTLSARRNAAVISKNTTALLEVLPDRLSNDSLHGQ
ncbi:hypothetical protein [Granulicella tundricola]|uniref:Uncharacterized protein n=1 Tax=Granulicella tundricola (strain ATCC BAA-1859 / DSM 23138 / MP5ACTX9) TaxID=1198114 RepID=E8X6N0_GRATM|nr:hypothetical protein [Granulicella tundricola]ADW71180.1 hypothetical protein AciX9_3904 [Granulicella tundricola MP5ACTX9]